MPSSPPAVIVFANLDAAPLGAFDRVDRLAALLETLRAGRIMTVFMSRRTRAQVEGIRQSLGIFHPFVCEGGAGAFVPQCYFGGELRHARRVAGYEAIDFGAPYAHVVDTLQRVAAGLGVPLVGFSDLPLEAVARECGCTLLEARYAGQREYGVAFRLPAPDALAERRLLKALTGAGLTCVRHDPFHHAATVRGAGTAVETLTALYRAAFGAVVTIEAGKFASSPPQTQVEWLERIVLEADRVRRPDSVIAR